MLQETCRELLTPTGELSLKDRKIQGLTKALLEGIVEKILMLDLRNNLIGNLENKTLSTLTHLRALDLRGNKLEILPESISALIHLKFLKLDHNLLTALPQELFKLPLTLLTLSDNSLFLLSPQIAQMKILSILVISDNQIKAIPPEIGELEQLKTLHLHGNEFFLLPTSLGQLSILEELSLEWLRYTAPSLTKIIKGHIGDAIICSLRELLHRSFRTGMSEISLRCFLEHFSERNFCINKIDIRGRSLLHLAVSNGDIGVVKGLVESGCDLDLMDIDGFSPLVVALREDNVPIAKILVQAGARLDVGGGSFGSVLNLAVIKSEPWLVNAIIKAGIDVNIKDCEGNSCLHHLMTVYKKHKHRNALIADMVIQAGVLVNAVNSEKWAAVHVAARKGQNAAFRWIYNKNLTLFQEKRETFDLNLAGGNRGWSPLHIASHSGHYKTVETLVGCGVDVYIKTSDGKTPKDTAKGDLSIYKFLSRSENQHIRLLIQYNKAKDKGKKHRHEMKVQSNSVGVKSNRKGSEKKEEASVGGVEEMKEGEARWDIQAVHGKDQEFERNEQGVYEKYRKMYEYFANNSPGSIEKMLEVESNTAVKADAVYAISVMKKRKAAKVLIMTSRGEESMMRSEALKALEGLQDIECRDSGAHTLIGPKLPRSCPLQMSLPTNISAYFEEETRIDTLLIL